MATRRHARRCGRLFVEFGIYGLVGLGATVALLVWTGVPWPTVALAGLGILAVLLLALFLQRTGLMRVPFLDDPTSAPDAGDDDARGAPGPPGA
ncbi:MAG: hypothetical protein ACRDP1_15060 [Nocardioidaceae bacterium]